MSHSRNEVKVGLFVLVGLALLAALMLQFSKGTSSFRKSYEIRLKATNIGGLRKNSFVLVSGVQVGSVSDIYLSEDARTVTLILKIFSNFKIHGDARFVIEQSGFLGDQYVGIIPTENKLPILEPGAEMRAEEPFNLQEAARSAIGFVQRADDSVSKINRIIEDLGKHLLNQQTMTNLAFAVEKFRRVSEEALVTVGNISALVTTNSPIISQSLSNVSTFSKKLGQAGDSVQQLIIDNRPQIDAAIKNLQAATVTLTNLLNEVQSGKGLAGTVIGNETVATNFAHVVENLSVTTSNLNRLGLWRMLWKPREAKTQSTSAPSSPTTARSPKDK
jgi:phospholipid/cholesterol/gamma-HCH transport system substrate-binding protein